MNQNSDSTKKDALFQRDLRESYSVITRGEGIYLFDDQGKRYIDGTSGAGNVTLGHGYERIVEAMAEQAKTLAYCFSQFFTNQPALELAERIAALAPGDLNHVYFVSGGSEGNETAIKLARQYHLQRGNKQKQQVISRWRSYHGATLGALALTGSPALRAPFNPWLPDFPHIAPYYPYRCPFAGCEGRCNLTCADELERTILQVGPENVAAFLTEPVVLAGVAADSPPPDYFPRIREICDKYDVLFIADEVITGFGRTGRYFAIEHWDVVPDMIVFAKGISSGYAPLGGVILREKIRDSFAEQGEAFAHVFTYVNNPVAMRAGLEVLDIIEENNLLEHVRQMGEHLLTSVDALHRYASVGEIRGKGLMMGIELVRDKASKEPFAASMGVHKRMREILLDKGLSMSGTSGAANWVDGDDLRFYPPLTITRDEIDESIAILDEGLGQLEEELSL
ncbi:aspartate aminotransferase family protein [Chloroflexi bacterium TSY]|nr:aspartate aminotransferase family protein [Chloroflexi bacterium TSY]